MVAMLSIPVKKAQPVIYINESESVKFYFIACLTRWSQYKYEIQETLCFRTNGKNPWNKNCIFCRGEIMLRISCTPPPVIFKHFKRSRGHVMMDSSTPIVKPPIVLWITGNLLTRTVGNISWICVGTMIIMGNL